MKGESFLSISFSVPRERQNVACLGVPASKNGDRSVALCSLKPSAPSTTMGYSIFSD